MLKSRSKTDYHTTAGGKQRRRHRHLSLHRFERAHFNFGSNDRNTFLNRIRPTVRRFAQAGIQKPLDVCRKLNEDSMRTACGERWSPRLTTLLLAMLYEKPKPGHPGLWDRVPSSVNTEATPSPGQKATKSHAKPVVVNPAPKQPARKQPKKPALKSADPQKQTSKRQHKGNRSRPKQPRPEVVPPIQQRSRFVISPETAAHIISKLPSLHANKIIGVWQNAIDLLAKPEKINHRTARKVIQAIHEEWDKRARHPDDYFEWPSTVAEEGENKLGRQDWPEIGLLKFLGYMVGRTQGVCIAARRLRLSEIFCGSLPPINSPAYMMQWGSPGSAARLSKMAETIAAFARNAKRRDELRLDDAIRDWEGDLKFLYDKYYVGYFRFAWPGTAR
jgi:hypothetical protein